MHGLVAASLTPHHLHGLVRASPPSHHLHGFVRPSLSSTCMAWYILLEAATKPGLGLCVHAMSQSVQTWQLT